MARRDARCWVRPPFVTGKSQAKECQLQNTGKLTSEVHFKVSKLRDPEIRDRFKLMLHNRFEVLQQLIKEEDLPVEDEWMQIEKGAARRCWVR